MPLATDALVEPMVQAPDPIYQQAAPPSSLGESATLAPHAVSYRDLHIGEWKTPRADPLLPPALLLQRFFVGQPQDGDRALD